MAKWNWSPKIKKKCELDSDFLVLSHMQNSPPHAECICADEL